MGKAKIIDKGWLRKKEWHKICIGKLHKFAPADSKMTIKMLILVKVGFALTRDKFKI